MCLGDFQSGNGCVRLKTTIMMILARSSTTLSECVIAGNVSWWGKVNERYA